MRATTRPSRPRRTPAAAPQLLRRALVLVLAGVLLVACGNGDSSDASSASGADAAPEAGADGAALDVLDTTVPDRDLVVDASVVLAVDDVRAATDRLRVEAVAAGGFVAQESSRAGTGTDDGEGAGATLVLRVPASDVDGVLAGLRDVGEVRDRSTRVADVTAQRVDVEARLASSRASVQRVRALLERAGSLQEVAAVEAELARREGDLESLQARSQTLAAQVALATVTVEVVSSADPAGVVTSWTDPGDAFAVGVRALVATGAVLLAVVAALTPFLLVAAPLVAVVVLAVRRRRSRPQPVAAGPA